MLSRLLLAMGDMACHNNSQKKAREIKSCERIRFTVAIVTARNLPRPDRLLLRPLLPIRLLLLLLFVVLLSGTRARALLLSLLLPWLSPLLLPRSTPPAVLPLALVAGRGGADLSVGFFFSPKRPGARLQGPLLLALFSPRRARAAALRACVYVRLPPKTKNISGKQQQRLKKALLMVSFEQGTIRAKRMLHHVILIVSLNDSDL